MFCATNGSGAQGSEQYDSSRLLPIMAEHITYKSGTLAGSLEGGR